MPLIGWLLISEEMAHGSVASPQITCCQLNRCLSSSIVCKTMIYLFFPCWYRIKLLYTLRPLIFGRFLSKELNITLHEHCNLAEAFMNVTCEWEISCILSITKEKASIMWVSMEGKSSSNFTCSAIQKTLSHNILVSSWLSQKESCFINAVFILIIHGYELAAINKTQRSISAHYFNGLY